MADVVIYHNPDCGTSRNALAMIRHAGIEPEVVEYLTTPPTKARVRELAYLMGLTVRDMIRERGTPFTELNLGRPSLDEEDLLEAIEAHPILMNRPIVVTPTRVKLCRPSDTVLDLLSSVPLGDFDKDDGTPFLRDTEIAGSNDDLQDAMTNVVLPTDDLTDPGQTFYRYNLLGGLTVGYGGFFLAGHDVLLRSVARTERSDRRVGPTLVQLLMSRAFDRGGRQAFALTKSPQARSFFESQGFTELDRASAPPSIQSTRQMTSLCPSSATLLTRRMSL